jgi:hypothetical protein
LTALIVSFLVTSRFNLVWKAFAALVIFASADEAASLHEELVSPLRTIFDAGGIFYFAWVIAAIPAVAIAAVVLRNIFEPLEDSESKALKVALIILVVGAIGGEMIGGPFADKPDSTPYVLITHAEEAAEFVGASLLLWSLLLTVKRMLDSGHAAIVPSAN